MPRLYCAVHQINRSVQVSYKDPEFKPYYVLGKKANKFFIGSSKADRKLKATAERMGVKIKSLTNEPHKATRFNSAFKMYRRLSAAKEAITTTLSELSDADTRREKPAIPPMAWAVFEESSKPMKDATVILSHQQIPMIGKLPQIMAGLLSQFDPANRMLDSESPATQGLKTRFYHELKTKWEEVKASIPDILLLGQFLDWTTKDFGWMEDPVVRDASRRPARWLSNILQIGLQNSVSLPCSLKKKKTPLPLPAPAQRHQHPLLPVLLRPLPLHLVRSPIWIA
eukprot:TRINITY_DN12935_c0_g1_i2.p1 TRINITY_DN12935_c0_g1~~TRINITY_DN12935_c0_g1_i2.p1  ORF type:complete len:283 (-),score=34.31 TRINITY_DN12935_c0_g1_i2:430-1278(-)